MRWTPATSTRSTCTRCRRSRRSWTPSARSGFRFKSADLEQGHIRGTRQQLPFYQEIEFLAPQQYRGLNQVELTFVADDREMDVVLEMDKKPGLFSEGSDTYRSFTVGLNDFQGTDWAAYLNQWLAEVGGKRNWF